MLIHAFIFYVLALVSCVGAGSMMWTVVLRRLVPGTSPLAEPSSLELGFTGLLAFGVIAVFLNFFVPVSSGLSMFMIVLCLIMGFVKLIKAPKPGLFELLVFLAVIMLFAVWGSKFMLRVDSGVYHLQAISWIKDEPIVIGLANVHHRFGFDSLWLSALAVFWLPYYDIKGVLLANYLPSIIFVLVLVNDLLKIPRIPKHGLSISTVFALCCLVGLSLNHVLLMTNTTSTDLAPNVFTLLSVFVFLRGVGCNEYAVAEVKKDHLLLWAIAVFAALTKLSAITPALLALVYLLYHKDVIGMVTVKRTLIFLTVVSATWILRNFLLSGCLLYPVGITCADTGMVPWSVGSGNADFARVVVERWAKAPGGSFLADGVRSDWFAHWLEIQNRGGRFFKIGLRVAGAVAAGLLYLLALLAFRRNASTENATSVRNPLTGIGLVMLASSAGLFFGFLTAPDPRFWWGSYLALLLAPASLLAFLLMRGGALIGSRSIIVALFAAAILSGLYIMNRGISWQAITQPMETFRQVIPEAQTETVSATGFYMQVPSDDGMCWLAAKPCSPDDPMGLRRERVGPYLVYMRETK